jgi:hypothetical protein
MEIVLELHTLKRALERGASKEEITSVILNGYDIPAKRDKLARTLVFDFKNMWNSKFYEQKRIEVIYTIEDDKIVTITVYVFYGKWE